MIIRGESKMATKDRLQVSMDKELKERVSRKLAMMGLNTSTVVQALFIQIDAQDKVPFDFSLSEKQKEIEGLRETISEQGITQTFENESDFAKWYDDEYGDY